MHYILYQLPLGGKKVKIKPPVLADKARLSLQTTFREEASLGSNKTERHLESQTERSRERRSKSETSPDPISSH